MKYLKEFNSVDQLKRHYENINFAIPNVFQFNDNDELKLEFNDNETIVTVYDINHNISGPTNLWTTYNGDIYESIYVDNVKVNNVNYPLVKTNLSEGKHIIKFKLKDKENLGDSAPVFYNECLIYAHIPSCFKTIKTNAFNHCSGLKAIIIPNSIESIEQRGIAYCTNLTHVNILNDSITIADNVFEDCTNLDNETKEKILQINPHYIFSYYWYIGKTEPVDPNSAPGLITPVLTGNRMGTWHELGLGWHVIPTDSYNAIHGTNNHLYTTFNDYSADNTYAVTISENVEQHDYYLVVPHGTYFKDATNTTFYFNEKRIGTTEIDGISYDIYKDTGDEFNLYIYL